MTDLSASALGDPEAGAAEPSPTCARCPRLVAYRDENALKQPTWFNGAVSSFGDEAARLLVVGLAPGVSGANKTGRPFTGDYAGDLLYGSLDKFGFSEGRFQARPDDGLRLIDAMITNAVRCVPPQNKPIGAEINACRPFLINRVAALPELKAMLLLGRIAHETVLRAFGFRLAAHPFAHGARHDVEIDGRAVSLFDSYHCSRYNTNTGRLTPEMFHSVFSAIRDHLGPSR